MLAPLFGNSAFDAGGHRFAQFVFSSADLGAEFATEWDNLRRRYHAYQSVYPTSGPLASTAGALDPSDGRLQHRLTTQLEDAAESSLDETIMGLPYRAQLRHAWLSCDAFSSQWVTAWPSDEHAISHAEFSEVMATYLGLPSPALVGLTGRRIPDGPTQHRICDQYGIQLACAHLPGRGWDDHHDSILRVLYRDLTHCGIRGDLKPRDLFASALPAAAIRRVGPRRLGIIPDLRLRDVPFPDRHHSGRTHGFLFDLKTVHDGTDHYLTAEARRTRAAAVAARARAVPTAYEALARGLDERNHGVRGDAVRAGLVGAGPVLRLLRSFPECVGLVFGAFGEASPSVHELCAHAAAVGSEQGWRRMGARSAAEAHGFLTGRLRRSWGVAAVRAAAHLRISRLSFVGMPTRVVQGLRRAARAPYRGPVNPRVFAAGLRPDIGARRFGRG